ncbi:MAG: hypothetical protein GY913_33930 [Proteobacteria bacterium]|nr:hypothetical protein [Pseudomonadota bacterium]MCP4921928.1 hypothetical protein [Pseudomonadota bacterium]
MRFPILLLAAPLLALGCNNGGNGDGSNDTGPSDDSGIGTPNYDEGCLVLDGGQSFAWLSDALVVADEGSTIDLTGCGDLFEQTAEVTKSVNIVGPGESMVWNAPVNEPALTITGASDVNVSGFTLISTRNGLVLDASSNVTFDAIVFADIANTAIKATDSAIAVTNSTFTAPQYGGIDLSGGTASVSGNTFDAPLAFAVRATDDAVATVSDNVISDVMYTDATDGISDGFALFGDGGSFVTENNTLTNNIVAVFVTQGDVTMSGDVMEGGLYGVFSQLGAVDIDSVTITDATTQGLQIVAQDDPVSVTNTAVSGDPELVYTTADPDGWTGAAAWIQTNAGINIESVTIDGYNARGILLAGYDDSGTDLSVNDLTITNTGRYGLTLQWVDAVMSDVLVDTVRLVDDPALVNQDYSYSVGYGALIYESDVQWTGGGILDSEVIGMVSQYATVNFDTVELSGHQDLGVWGIYTTLDVRNSEISMSPALGGIANYYGDAVVADNTFVDNLATEFYEYDSTSWTYLTTGTTGNHTAGDNVFTDENATFETWGLVAGDAISSSANGSWNYITSVDSETQLTMDYAWSYDGEDTTYYVYQGTPRTYGYEYSNQSQDIVCSSGTSMEITGNTFSNGSQSVWFSGCEGVVVEDNAWDGYTSGYVLQFSSGPDTAKVSNNTIANTGPFPVYCYNSTVDIEELTITGSGASSTDITYYTDGEETGSYVSSYSGEAIYASTCTMTLDTVSVTDAAYNAIYAYDTTLELFDVSVEGGSDLTTELDGTINAVWSAVDPYFLVDGVDVTDAGLGAGIGITVADGLGSGTIQLDSATVTGSTGSGLDINGATATVMNSSFTGNENGILSTGSDLILDTVDLSTNTTWGYTNDATTYLSSLDATGLTVSANAGGTKLDSLSTVVFDESTIDSNTEEGMSCDDDTVWVSCTNNTIDDAGDCDYCAP